MKPKSLILTLVTALFASGAFVSLALAEQVDPSPKVDRIILPKLSSDLADASGKVDLMVAVGINGEVASVNVLFSSDDRLNDPSLRAIEKWGFNPATSNGSPVIGLYRHTFRFDDGQHLFGEKLWQIFSQAAAKNPPPAPTPAPAPAATPARPAPEPVRNVATRPAPAPTPAPNPADQIMRPPTVSQKYMPDLPSQLSGIRGFVKVQFDIDESGKVERVTPDSYSHEELVEEVLSAAKRWKFYPAMEGLEAKSAKLIIPFRFGGRKPSIEELARIEDETSSSIDHRPVVIREPSPLTPEKLKDVEGEVDMLVCVDEYGFVFHAEATKASHKELAASVTKALYNWKFQPALSRSNAIDCKMRLGFIFRKGTVISKNDDLDIIPEAKLSPQPRLSRALSRLEGYVLLHMRIDVNGDVVDSRVVESTNSRLDRPTMEAASQWKFSPGYKAGKAVESTLVVPFFYPING